MFAVLIALLDGEVVGSTLAYGDKPTIATQLKSEFLNSIAACPEEWEDVDNMWLYLIENDYWCSQHYESEFADEGGMLELVITYPNSLLSMQLSSLN